MGLRSDDVIVARIGVGRTRVAASKHDVLEDQYLTFNCYQLSRSVRAGRPLSRRWITASQRLCTDDKEKICIPGLLYSFWFYESSDQEEEQSQKETSKRLPDIPLDRIGVFHPNGDHNIIHVPSDFMERLWAAAVAADGVLRSFSISIQPQGRDGLEKGLWAVFEVTLNEMIAEPFELSVDKQSKPKIGPPRLEPAVVELRALRAGLKWPTLSGVITVTVGVLIALWIAKLWH